MEDGLYTNLTNGQYHGIRGYISASALKAFEKSPLHYQAYLKRDWTQTQDQLLGTMFHELVLEPEIFSEKYVVIDGDRRSKEVKAAVEQAESTGKIAIKSEMLETVKIMAENTSSKIKRMNLFTPSGISECSIFVTDPLTGCPIKVRPDRVEPDLGVIYDLKSYSSAVEYEFRGQIYRMRYDRQAALYLRACSIHFGRTFTDFVNIVCETDAPWEVGIIRIDDATIDRATERMIPLLEKFKQCLDTDSWPGLEDNIVSTNIDII